MKRSAEIQSLPIFSLVDGAEIGKVKQLIINPAAGRVQNFLVENDQDAIGIHVLPYAGVIGVGDFAVTVETTAAIQEVGSVEGARELVLLGYKIIGTRVLSRKGQLLGEVVEYYVDEATGEVTACSFAETGKQDSRKLFDRANIMTFGRDVIVIHDEAAIFTSFDECEAATVGTDVHEPIDPLSGVQAPDTPGAVTSKETILAAIADAEQQAAVAKVETLAVGPYAYLIGKVLSADLLHDSGEVLAAAGDVITDELIERIKGESPTLFMKLNRLASSQE